MAGSARNINSRKTLSRLCALPGSVFGRQQQLHLWRTLQRCFAYTSEGSLYFCLKTFIYFHIMTGFSVVLLHNCVIGLLVLTWSQNFRYSLKRDWSSCSEKYLEDNRKFGGQTCLVNVPEPDTIYTEPICGNDIVETGEQCDCGPPELCQRYLWYRNTIFILIPRNVKLRGLSKYTVYELFQHGPTTAIFLAFNHLHELQ